MTEASGMFIKRNKREEKGKIYAHRFLVPSINTPKGPRHEGLYTLGSLEGIDPRQDRQLAMQLEKMILGQITLTEVSQQVKEIFEKLRPVKGRSAAVDVEVIQVEPYLPESANVTSDTTVEQRLLPSVAVEQPKKYEV